MEATSTTYAESAILTRVISPNTGDLPKTAAQVFLGLAFPQSDIDRMNALADKNRRGEASDQELQQLEHYSRVGNLLNLLQSKARRSLANG